jgi:DNA-binding NarL/FixJ family response regulator
MRRLVATALLEPCALFREGLARILAGTSFRVAASASSIETLQFSAPESRPALIIIGEDGAGTLRTQVAHLRNEFPSAHIAVLADDLDLENFKAVFRAGANAYLLKALTADALVKSLDLLMMGGVVIPDAVLSALCGAEPEFSQPQPIELTGLSETTRKLEAARPLSGRETDILQCIVRGDSNKHIARRYDIAEATVKVHVKAILRKIGVRNRTQAAIWALSCSASEIRLEAK